VIESELRTVPRTANATNAGSADRLDGLDSTDFLRIGSGRTIAGAFQIEADGGATALISFPISANLSGDDAVNFAPHPAASDDDSTCTGDHETQAPRPGRSACTSAPTRMRAACKASRTSLVRARSWGSSSRRAELRAAH
jgi:hypothetical protein